ncbi:MAG: spore coat protein CotH [Myxococcota bacterium]|jgi:spore coat protein CotH
MLALLILACSPDEPDPPLQVLDDSGTPDTSDTAVDTDTDTTPPDTGPADTEPPPVTEEVIGDHTLEDDWIFAYDVIHEVEITLPEASVTALGLEPYTYTEGSVTFDGEAIPLIGVRLRGKIGSFRELSGKPKFKLDFNQYVEDQRFYGLETLSLNNSVVDCSYLKEHIGYALFEAAGVPASRTGIARVSVNGSPYGLYTIIEVPDDRFLRRHYTDPSGNLYDGKYVWDGYNYTLLDFAEGNDTLFQLEEGTDVGHVDITEISSTILEVALTPDYYTGTSEVVDWPLLHRMWAVEQFIGQNDG